jgi:hypothetical protein
MLQTLGSWLEGESLHNPRIILASLLELLQSQLVILQHQQKSLFVIDVAFFFATKCF